MLASQSWRRIHRCAGISSIPDIYQTILGRPRQTTERPKFLRRSELGVYSLNLLRQGKRTSRRRNNFAIRVIKNCNRIPAHTHTFNKLLDSGLLVGNRIYVDRLLAIGILIPLMDEFEHSRSHPLLQHALNSKKGYPV